jgi:hypothetical protein
MTSSAASTVPQLLTGDRNRAAKITEKQTELAWHALDVLPELGFARVNLREVANR